MKSAFLLSNASKGIRINLDDCRYTVVKKISKKLGFVVDDNKDNQNTDTFGEEKAFNIKWMDKNSAYSRVERLKNFQCINHFPGITSLSHRHKYHRIMENARKKYPKDFFHFFPESYVLDENREFENEVGERNDDKKENYWYSSRTDRFLEKKLDELCEFSWILKPKRKSPTGSGLSIIPKQEVRKKIPKLFRKAYSNNSGIVLQKYVDSPQLMEKKKFDLRCYCVITCLEPLMIYSFDKGFVRLAEKAYQSCENANSPNIQITVHSNTRNEAMNKNECIYDTGNLRCFGFLKKWLENLDVRKNAPSFDQLRMMIDDLMFKAIIPVFPVLYDLFKEIREKNCSRSPFDCFEILGFDILLDEDFCPHLLDICHSPSYRFRSSLEEEVKRELITETIHMIGIETFSEYYDHQNFTRILEAKVEAEKYCKFLRRIFPSKYNISVYGYLLDEFEIRYKKSCYEEFFLIKGMNEDISERVEFLELRENYIFSNEEKKSLIFKIQLRNLEFDVLRNFLYL